MAGQADSLNSILYALVANLLIAIAKLMGALFTSSSAMMAEAVHSFADSGNQALLLLGLRQAKKPPTPEHPLGYGKAIYFWSFIVALILFSMGGVFSIREGLHKLDQGGPLEWPWVAVAILIFSIVAESISLRKCIVEINKVRGERSLWRWFRESRRSELIVILGEDFAALLGLVLALVAIILAIITGNSAFDAFGSIVIGVLLVLVAIGIGNEVKALLIGQGVEKEDQIKIKAYLEGRDEIVKVLNVLTLQMGDDVMVAVKAQMCGVPTTQTMVDAINRTEVALKEYMPQITWIFFEPDDKL